MDPERTEIPQQETNAAPQEPVAAIETKTPKTDIPLPLASPIVEAFEQPEPRLVDRMISGIDLIDFGAGGLMPNHVYLVKGGGRPRQDRFSACSSSPAASSIRSRAS